MKTSLKNDKQGRSIRVIITYFVLNVHSYWNLNQYTTSPDIHYVRWYISDCCMQFEPHAQWSKMTIADKTQTCHSAQLGTSTEIENITKRGTFREVVTFFKTMKRHKNNSKKRGNRAESALVQYITLVNCDCTDFWNFTVCDLYAHLCKFWFAVRQTEMDPDTKEPFLVFRC